MSPFFDPRMALYDAFGPMSNKGHMNLESGAGYGNMKPPCGHGLAARRQLNWLAIFMALFVPFGLFVVTFYAMSFELYYRYPQRALMVVALCVFFTLIVAAFTVQAKRTEIGGGQRTWHFFVFSTSFLACFLGSSLGYVNFTEYAVRYYDYISLRKAVAVDPGQWQGQSLLDAGEIDFKAGTKIDRSLHSLWHKGKTWCVAPIVSKDGAKLASYDFWAVGMDCCSSKPGDFSCGVVYTSWTSGVEAPAGLRVMDSSEIQGYKLAVEQAAAAYNLQSQRPIFLYMQKTPYLTIKEYFNNAKLYMILSCSCFFVMQMVLVYAQTYIFGKDAPSGYMDMHKTSHMFFHH